MEQGIIPWHKTWTSTKLQDFDSRKVAFNRVTKKAYSPLNQILLSTRRRGHNKEHPIFEILKCFPYLTSRRCTVVAKYTEAQKQAVYKYKKENIKRISLEIQKTEYEAFRDYCDDVGKPVNTILREFIKSCI